MSGHHHEHADPAALVAAAESRLRASGARVTRSRRLLLRTLAATDAHLSADQVAVRLSDSGIDRSTVFRGLEAFAAAGVVVHHQVPGGATAYHLAPTGHLHLHCGHCHEVFAVDPEVFAPVIAAIGTSTGFTLDPVRSSFSGTCAHCRERDRPT